MLRTRYALAVLGIGKDRLQLPRLCCSDAVLKVRLSRLPLTGNLHDSGVSAQTCFACTYLAGLQF